MQIHKEKNEEKSVETWKFCFEPFGSFYPRLVPTKVTTPKLSP
jgi:hypothetical protein